MPPLNTRIFFLAGEWGCSPCWYYGYVWQSSDTNQRPQFYVIRGEAYPPFHAPEYQGKYIIIEEGRENES